MAGNALFNLSVAFSLISGTAAGLLALLTWKILRRSPFGKAVFVLSSVMILFTVYHVMLLVNPSLALILRELNSVVLTGACVFVWSMIWSQRRLRRHPATEGDGR